MRMVPFLGEHFQANFINFGDKWRVNSDFLCYLYPGITLGKTPPTALKWVGPSSPYRKESIACAFFSGRLPLADLTHKFWDQDLHVQRPDDS